MGTSHARGRADQTNLSRCCFPPNPALSAPCSPSSATIEKQRVARIDASPVLVDHQGSMNPLRFLMQVVRRANRRLDEVNDDDTELEDELELG